MIRVEFPGTPSELELFGALIEVELTVPVPLKQFLKSEGFPPHKTVRGYALIDTGAGVSAVDETVMAELQIPELDGIETLTPHGLARSNVYNASACFPQLRRDDVELDHVIGCFLRPALAEAGIDVLMLIGRDLLRQMQLTYDGRTGIVTLEA